MSRYDYGLRGPRDTPAPRFPQRRSRYPAEFEERRSRSRLLERVTARYNLDYVRPDIEASEANRFAPDWGDRIGDEAWYRRPYVTRGGTRTMRGSPLPPRDEPPRYGPDYGGRYPDEL